MYDHGGLVSIGDFSIKQYFFDGLKEMVESNFIYFLLQKKYRRRMYIEL